MGRLAIPTKRFGAARVISKMASFCMALTFGPVVSSSQWKYWGGAIASTWTSTPCRSMSAIRRIGVDELGGLGGPELAVVAGALLGLELHPGVVLGPEEAARRSRRPSGPRRGYGCRSVVIRAAWAQWTAPTSAPAPATTPLGRSPLPIYDHPMEHQRPVAVIGLGLMGSAMSGNLLGAGHQVRGYDPDPLRLAELEGKGGVATGSPAEAVQGCWAALLSLPTSDISREVCLGEQGIAGPGRPVSLSTTPPPAAPTTRSSSPLLSPRQMSSTPTRL